MGCISRLGLFIRTLRNSIWNERSHVFIDGRILFCDKNWIRDHVHIMKAMRHREYDLSSFIIETQREDGQFYELIKQHDDIHWKFVNEDCRVMYPEGRAIIEEYLERRKTTEKFAEWFSIDPPYEMFGRHPRDNYVNGAISPFTAGELARAAFEYGYEEYGWDIITRMMELAERDNTMYFLYNSDSTPQPEGGPSAWGAAAMMNAIDEGLAGIRNLGVRYDEMAFSPRFPVTHYTELRYLTGYESTGTLVDVRYILKDEGMRYDIYSPAKKITAHILVPEGRTVRRVLSADKDVDFKLVSVAASTYADMEIVTEDKSPVKLEILF